jgi:transcriptional regulator GlxA family with amidase domain
MSLYYGVSGIFSKTPFMKKRLDQIQDWPERAQAAKWSAATLAKDCGVSLRTLERHFLKNMGKSPKQWLLEQRHQKADEMLKEGLSVKETAGNLGCNHDGLDNFRRDFKAHMGFCPATITVSPRAQNP